MSGLRSKKEVGAIASTALAFACTALGACKPKTPAVLSVVTMWPGAPSSEVERAISLPIEDLVRGSAGIDAASVDTVSVLGASAVIGRVRENASTDASFADLRARLDRLAHAASAATSASALPESSLAPVVDRADTGTAPVLRLTLVGTSSRAEASAVLQNFVGPRLERLPGVARVSIAGAAWRELDVVVDPARADALDVTPAEIAHAIGAHHVRRSEDVLAVQVRERAGAPVLVRDVAAVAEGSRGDRPGALALVAWKDPDASDADVKDALLGELGDTISGMHAKVDRDAPYAISVAFIGADAKADVDAARAVAGKLAHDALLSVDAPAADAPALVVDVDRDAAAALRVSPADAARAISFATGGLAVAKLDGLHDVDVRVRVAGEPGQAVAAAGVRSSDGVIVPLARIAAVKNEAAPAVLERSGGERAARVCMHARADRDDAVNAVRAALATTPLAAGVRAIVEAGPLLPISACALAQPTHFDLRSP